jgi:hypothetical protein
MNPRIGADRRDSDPILHGSRDAGPDVRQIRRAVLAKFGYSLPIRAPFPLWGLLWGQPFKMRGVVFEMLGNPEQMAPPYGWREVRRKLLTVRNLA